MRRIPRDVDYDDAMAALEYEDMYRPTRGELELEALEELEKERHRPVEPRHSPADTEREDEDA